MKAQEENIIDNYNGFSLQVSSFMYVFIYSFDMHGICMWLFGYDVSLSWMVSWIGSSFSLPYHFLDNHGVVHFTFYFLVGSHVPYGCGLSY